MKKSSLCLSCESRNRGVFCNLSEELLREVDAVKTTNRYKPHQVIFYEGNQPFGLHCVGSGKVKIYKTDVDGHQRIVRLAGPGDVIGYRCLLSGERYSATGETIEEAEVCFLDKATFFKILERDPRTSFNVMNSLAQNLRHAEDQMNALVHKNVRERLAELFLVFHGRYGKKTADGIKLDISLTREELAELVGTTQESVIRLISEFKNDGLISARGREITLLDVDGLAQTANIVD